MCQFEAYKSRMLSTGPIKGQLIWPDKLQGFLNCLRFFAPPTLERLTKENGKEAQTCMKKHCSRQRANLMNSIRINTCSNIIESFAMCIFWRRNLRNFLAYQKSTVDLQYCSKRSPFLSVDRSANKSHPFHRIPARSVESYFSIRKDYFCDLLILKLQKISIKQDF